MLEALKNIAKTLIKLDQDKLVKQALADKALQAEIIRMNTQEQLYEQGVDADGISLGDYSPATIEGTKNFLGKKQKGQRYDHITLNDTGAFYDSFKFVNENEDFIITANTRKKDTDLREHFGAKILGLTKEHIGYVIPEVKKNVLDILRKKILT